MTTVIANNLCWHISYLHNYCSTENSGIQTSLAAYKWGDLSDIERIVKKYVLRRRTFA